MDLYDLSRCQGDRISKLRGYVHEVTRIVDNELFEARPGEREEMKRMLEMRVESAWSC